MDKEQAVHEFWSSFGLMAYDENTVPDDAVMPYITYSVSTGRLEDVLPLNASLWYHSTAWDDISIKSNEIADYIGYGGRILPLDTGYMYVVMGTPFSQRMSDSPSQDIRRIYINILVEFFTPT